MSGCFRNGRPDQPEYAHGGGAQAHIPWPDDKYRSGESNSGESAGPGYGPSSGDNSSYSSNRQMNEDVQKILEAMAKQAYASGDYSRAVWNNYGEVIGWNVNGAGYTDKSTQALYIHGGGEKAYEVYDPITSVGRMNEYIAESTANVEYPDMYEVAEQINIAIQYIPEPFPELAPMKKTKTQSVNARPQNNTMYPGATDLNFWMNERLCNGTQGTDNSENYFNDKYFETLSQRMAGLKKWGVSKNSRQERFDNIKSDIINHGSDLHKLRVSNEEMFNNLFESIDYLVTKIDMTEEVHYFRNELNKYSGAPKSLDDMIGMAKSGKWNLYDPVTSQYHMYGENGEYNLKFVSSNGRFEAVYDVNKELITEETNPINMGTYNYATGWLAHNKYDVKPWEEWDNVKNESDKGETKYNLFNWDMYKYHDSYKELINNKLRTGTE